jgi:hypothetical protein
MISLGIESETFRLAVQSLNQLRYRVSSAKRNKYVICELGFKKQYVHLNLYLYPQSWH